MNQKVMLFLFLGMVAVGLSGYYAVRLGLYPVAVINARFIGARSFAQAADIVGKYYGQLLSQASQNTPSIFSPNLPPAELRRATLDKMVENVLIYNELRNRAGNDLDRLVEGKLEPLKASNPDFEKAVSTLYGLSAGQFTRDVLIPAAHEEILRGYLDGEKKTGYDEWLVSARTGASVIILAPDLRWDGRQVVNK